MSLESIALQSFRSYSKHRFVLSATVTIIVGDNTTGKTNIIESIYLLSTGKSFRADLDRDVIRWGSEVARITGKTSEESLEIVITSGVVSGRKAPLKKFLHNGVSRRMIDFVGAIPAVLFWPEHVVLVTGSPSARRKYLDSVLIQTDQEYRRNLLSYERGLRQRNKVLDAINDGKAGRSQLLFWDQLLIASGRYLTDARWEFVRYVNSVPMHGHEFRIDYDASVISKDRLTTYAQQEIAAKTTLVGPHRDDFVFSGTFSGVWQKLSSFGSRGEQRLAVLWLKLSEARYIYNKTGLKPLLLLDDIFSELDALHRSLVLDEVKQHQTIISTADTDVLDLVKSTGIEDISIIQLSEHENSTP